MNKIKVNVKVRRTCCETYCVHRQANACRSKWMSDGQRSSPIVPFVQIWDANLSIETDVFLAEPIRVQSFQIGANLSLSQTSDWILFGIYCSLKGDFYLQRMLHEFPMYRCRPIWVRLFSKSSEYHRLDQATIHRLDLVIRRWSLGCMPSVWIRALWLSLRS